MLLHVNLFQFMLIHLGVQLKCIPGSIVVIAAAKDSIYSCPHFQWFSHNFLAPKGAQEVQMLYVRQSLCQSAVCPKSILKSSVKLGYLRVPKQSF